MPTLELKPTHKAMSACRGSFNPNISIEAVEEMILRHILTEQAGKVGGILRLV